MILYETNRLILRNYSPIDLNDVFEYMSSDFTALHEDFYPYTLEDCEKAISRWCSSDFHWAIELKGASKVIGSLNFSKEEYSTYEIGYDFNEKYTRFGYATEAVHVLIKHIFSSCNGRRIVAGCNEGNIASLRLLEKLGFRKEGFFLEDVSFKVDADGKPIYVNSYYYGILKKEWEKQSIGD